MSNPMPDFRHDRLDCPACGAALTGSMNTTSTDRMEPGDTAICIYCATVLRYGDGLRLEREDRPEVLDDPDVARALWAVRRASGCG